MCGELSEAEVEQRFWRAWPLVAMWLRSEAQARAAINLHRVLLLRKMFPIWVESASNSPPPLVDSSDDGEIMDDRSDSESTQDEGPGGWWLRWRLLTIHGEWLNHPW